MRRGNVLCFCLGFLLFFCFATVLPAAAQLTEGTVVGTVTDASGAVVVGAKVTVKNIGTDFVIEAMTDDIGFYRVPHLSPGKYQVRVEKSGFKASVVEDVIVSVNVVARADVSLAVGEPTEIVTVTSTIPLVQTEEGRLSNTLTTAQVTELPLNGRQVYQLATLQPGVTGTNAPVISSVPSPTSAVTFGFGFIANGATPRGNNFVLDGVSNNNEWLGGQPLIYPSLEAIEEVQVQTLNFSAEYGRNNGAIVHVVTKAGTNNLHGSVFYSGRNTAFDARNEFDMPGQASPLHLNQFGFSVGGPVIRDKTFFFVNYEGSRLSVGNPALVIVETPAFRQMAITNFPNSLAALFFKDFPGPACIPGTQFSTGSVIPGATNPFAIGLPSPAQNDKCTAVAPNLSFNSSNQYMIRMDEHFTSRDQIFVRWIANEASGDVAPQELGPAANRGFKAPFDGFFAALGIGYTHEFSSARLNDFRFSYTRNRSDISVVVPSNTQTAQLLKAAGKPPDYFGDLSFNDGVLDFGGEVFVPRNFVFNTFGFNDTFTQVVGRHSIKVGFEGRHIQENSDYTLDTHPSYNFNSIYNFVNDVPLSSTALVNRNPASPNFGNFSDTPRHFRWSQWGAFVQDDWKALPRLTFNLGLRYDVFGSPSETNGLLSNIILGPGSTLLAQISDASVGRVKQIWSTKYNNFAPRIGLAWDPTGKGVTAIRSGFSIAYNEPYSNLYTNSSRLDPPESAILFAEPFFGIGGTTNADLNYTFPFAPSPKYKNPALPNGGVSQFTFEPSGVDPHLKTAYAMQWFLGVQHQFLHDYGFSVNYVGTRGVGTYTREDYNRFDGDICNQTTCNFFFTRLNPGWGEIFYVANEGQSIYHGLNAQLRKNYTRNFLFVANYTFGKVLDNVTEGGLGDYINVNRPNEYFGVQNIENPRADRGPSEFDVRHRFTLSGLWYLPSPKQNAALNRILGGWQLNTIVTLQSGRPFDVFCGNFWFTGCDFNMDDLSYDRPNRPANLKTSGWSNQQFRSGIFGDPSLTFYGPTFESSTSKAIQVFCPNGLNSIIDFGRVNSGPFAQCVPAGENGNLSRNAFRGPAYKTVDFGISKDTKVFERLTIQFRADAFNLFNRVNLFNPVSDMGSSQFGKSLAAFDPRVLQLGLKVLF
jgi:outer membrane receptor protein involved in Fe transport